MFPNVILTIFIFLSISDLNDGAGASVPLHKTFAPALSERKTQLKEYLYYKTYFYDQKIDHFGFFNNETFKQRYLVVDQFWQKYEGPIFFYTGGEGNIDWYCNNTGLMWDIAADFNALLIFAEHRYYGQSVPYGPDPFKNPTSANYLTSEQALADYVELIRHIQRTVPGTSARPIVAFGGSYGGMLAAWLRIKYPNIVIGSLASSAPVWQFNGITPCNVFYDNIANTWREVSSTCVDNVRRGFDVLDEIAKGKDYDFITKTFGLCPPIENPGDYLTFKNILRDMYVSITEANYPYKADYLADLPGWPVKEACSFLESPMKGKPLAQALSHVTNLFFNYTGNTKCVNWTRHSQSNIGYKGLDYQSCTEMVMPMCTNGSGLFYPIPWDFASLKKYCENTYQVTPLENWMSFQYWGQALKTASNIIFSNGLLDPWSGGSVLQSISDTVVAIQIPQGAQSFDLQFKNAKDTPDVVKARQEEASIIRKWLEAPPSF